MTRRTRIKPSVFSISPFSDPSTSDDSLIQLGSAQSNLSSMQAHLTTLVGALHSQPSMLGKIANFWGRQPLWLKALGGILLFGSIITIGVLANVVAITIVGSVLAAGFIPGGLLLDNHYKVSQRSQANLEEGVRSLGSVLKIIITALDKIRQQLAAEVAKLKVQNSKLAESIGKLDGKIGILGSQVIDLAVTKDALQRTEERLGLITRECTTWTLKAQELEAVKQEMAVEITKLKAVGEVLKASADMLSGSVFAEQSEREAFKVRLDDFFTNKTASFDKIADRVCFAERELFEVRRALDTSNERYAGLLERHESQMSKFEAVLARAAKSEAASTTSLREHGVSVSLFSATRKTCATTLELCKLRRHSISV